MIVKIFANNEQILKHHHRYGFLPDVKLTRQERH